jgi:DNA (cytosine-5)-methyltransferase 1/DNA (cytosine-5)-methyltransferase 3A
MQQIRSALSLFNGISGLHLALDKAQINVEQVYYSEIDKFANKVTEQHYTNDIALGDVTKWREWDIDWSSVDLVSAGFPCFAKGSSVLTKVGYKDISEVVIGDLVMTHKNRWKEVITLFHKENFIYKVKAQGLVGTETTEEHPYLVSKMVRVNGKRVFSKPDWVEVKDLKVGDFICYPKILNENNPLNLTLDEAYLVGRCVADGHTTMYNRTETGREDERFYNLILSVGSHKIPNTPIKHHLHKHTQSTHRMVFSNKRLVNIVEEHCGRGAKNKVISPMLLELPKDLLEQLVRGLLDGDGSSRDGVYSLTTVSKELVMSLNLAIMKLYGVVGNITYTKRPPKTVICGRTVNQSDTYTLRFTKEVRNQKHYHETEDYFLAPIKEVVETGSLKDVYNIEVDVDNSYTVNNCIVHNCQAWSVAGKQLGDKDERGMLFWTTLDIIKTVLEHNPKAKFLMENVKMKKDFEEYITHHTTEALGYVEKTLINSALVSAQNRNRYYWTNFEVTQPKDKSILLNDILEEVVDENFGLSNEAIDYMGRLRNGKPRWEYHKSDINGKAACLTANMYKGIPYGVLQLPNESATKSGKAYSLTASYGGAAAWNSVERKQRTMIPVGESDQEHPNVYNGILYRKLTPLECERLQTVPDNWTACLSNTQRYKSLGNGWTIDVIVHILECAYK